MIRRFEVHFKSNQFDHLSNYSISDDAIGYWWESGRHGSEKRAISAAKTLLKKASFEGLNSGRLHLIEKVVVCDLSLDSPYDTPIFEASNA